MESFIELEDTAFLLYFCDIFLNDFFYRTSENVFDELDDFRAIFHIYNVCWVLVVCSALFCSHYWLIAEEVVDDFLHRRLFPFFLLLCFQPFDL